MKLNVPTVFCVFCFVQVHSGREMNNDDADLKLFEQTVRDGIIGASERFIDDFVLIFEKYRDLIFFAEQVSRGLGEALVRGIPKNEETCKIDVDGFKKYKHDNELNLLEKGKPYEWSVYADYTILLQRILSKQLPPERYNGVINLYYALTNPNATTEQIESALGYLYGDEKTEVKAIDLPPPTATDCPEAFKRYSVLNDKLKSFGDIKPNLLRDFEAIIEKFPCNDDFGGISDFLEYFVQIVDRLRTLVSIDETKINACNIKKESNVNNYGLNCNLLPDANRRCRFTRVETVKRSWNNVETILSVRLADEAFRELINFVEATIIDATPINEVQKSLEYVFVDVAAPDC